MSDIVTPDGADELTLKTAAVAVSLGVRILNEMIGKELSKFSMEDNAELIMAGISNELGL